MVFVDAVDMQDGDYEGTVNFDEQLLRQGFHDIGQGGADHKKRLIDHEYARIILFCGEKGDLFGQEPLQGFILPHKNGLGHSGSAVLILFTPIY